MMNFRLSNGSIIAQVQKLLPRWLLFIAVTVILGTSDGFGKDKELNYLKNGLSFSLPGDWRTISDEALPDRGFYYSAESTEKNSTGLFTIVTISHVENAVKALLLQQQTMKEGDLYKDGGIEFTAIGNDHFGSSEAAMVNYESIVKGIKISGKIYCFNCSEKTYLLFFQSGLKDEKKNARAFRLIEVTFACR